MGSACECNELFERYELDVLQHVSLIIKATSNKRNLVPLHSEQALLGSDRIQSSLTPLKSLWKCPTVFKGFMFTTPPLDVMDVLLLTLLSDTPIYGFGEEKDSTGASVRTA